MPNTYTNAHTYTTHTRFAAFAHLHPTPPAFFTCIHGSTIAA